MDNGNAENSAVMNNRYIIIKASYNGMMKKTSTKNDSMTYDDFRLLLQRLFKGKLESIGDIPIEYKDQDGDWISITDDDDLFLVLSTMAHLNIRIGNDQDEKNMEEKIDQLLDSLNRTSLHIKAYKECFKKNIESKTPIVIESTSEAIVNHGITDKNYDVNKKANFEERCPSRHSNIYEEDKRYQMGNNANQEYIIEEPSNNVQKEQNVESIDKNVSYEREHLVNEHRNKEITQFRGQHPVNYEEQRQTQNPTHEEMVRQGMNRQLMLQQQQLQQQQLQQQYMLKQQQNYAVRPRSNIPYQQNPNIPQAEYIYSNMHPNVFPGAKNPSQLYGSRGMVPGSNPTINTQQIQGKPDYVNAARFPPMQ